MKSLNLSKIFDLSANPSEAHLEWEQFLGSSKKIPQKYWEHCLKIFGNSKFLARYLIRHPEAVVDLACSPYRAKQKSFSLFKNELEKIKEFSQIRKYKYQELLRITIRDLEGEKTSVILAELSSLAFAILQTVDRFLRSPHPIPYALLAMGKLGGWELNYSSDIDLLAVMGNGMENKRDPREFYTKHLQQLTHHLQQNSDSSFLYRVDWDLRPDGKGSPLINSLDSLEHYYSARGAEWERQALTKCAPASGDSVLAKQFIKNIEWFVYQRSINLQSIRQMIEMKNRIHEDLARKKTRGYHVKLGKGGIREVEFFVQSFLLIYGGSKERLRHTNTLVQLQRLSDERLISPKDADVLREGYLFLRKLENRLQMVEERQTHILGPSDEEKLGMARRMGYANKNPEEALLEFKKALEGHTGRINQLFEQLFRDVPRESSKFVSERRMEENPVSPYRQRLSARLNRWPHRENQIDEVRYFKRDELKTISELEKNEEIPRAEICRRISLTAEAVMLENLKVATEECQIRYGIPTSSHLSCLCMGKLGGREISYSSDLDLIFVFSENGETSGPTVIANSEFFARVVQKFIFLMTLTTRAGSAYSIDMELRPSGHFGPLVTSLSGFLDYQKKSSQIWEKQALLKARPLDLALPFDRLLERHLDALLFHKNYSPSIRHEMNRLRSRVEKEIAREGQEFFDMKGGRGGMMDIEFILQFFQLRYGAELPALRSPNTFTGLKQLYETNILNLADTSALEEIYTFYRTWEAKVQLKKSRSIHRFRVHDPFLGEIAVDLGLDTGERLLDHYFSYREIVRKIYNKVFD